MKTVFKKVAIAMALTLSVFVVASCGSNDEG